MTGARLRSHKRISLGWGRIWSVFSAWACAAPWRKIISRVSFRSLAIRGLFTKTRQWRFWYYIHRMLHWARKQDRETDGSATVTSQSHHSTAALSTCQPFYVCLRDNDLKVNKEIRRPKAQTEEWHYLHTRSWMLNFKSLIMEISKITQRAKVCYVSKHKDLSLIP